MRTELLGAVKFEVLTARPRITGSRIGRVIAVHGDQPTVDFPGNTLGPRPARWAASLATADLRRACGEALPVLLLFEDNDGARPVVVDLVASSSSAWLPDEATSPAVESTPRVVEQVAGRPSRAPGLVQLANVLGLEAGQVLCEPVGEAGHTYRAASVMPLRNLTDPVLVVWLDVATAMVVGQVLPSACLVGEGDSSAEFVIRGESVRIEAASILTLKAGSCTFELDARGRAVLVGDQIVSRARVSNKVQGGSVQLN